MRAPNGTTVVASCKGRGCPRGKKASQRAVVRRGIVRFRAFERSLRSGTRLVIYVMQQGRIGKYTRFTIRTGKSPCPQGHVRQRAQGDQVPDRLSAGSA